MKPDPVVGHEDFDWLVPILNQAGKPPQERPVHAEVVREAVKRGQRRLVFPLYDIVDCSRAETGIYG